MTTKELTEAVNRHEVSIGAINQALSSMTHNLLILHESIKGLEHIAEIHNAQIEELSKNTLALQQEWQAYLRSRPSH